MQWEQQPAQQPATTVEACLTAPGAVTLIPDVTASDLAFSLCTAASRKRAAEDGC